MNKAYFKTFLVTFYPEIEINNPDTFTLVTAFDRYLKARYLGRANEYKRVSNLNPVKSFKRKDYKTYDKGYHPELHQHFKTFLNVVTFQTMRDKFGKAEMQKGFKHL